MLACRLKGQHLAEPDRADFLWDLALLLLLVHEHDLRAGRAEVCKGLDERLDVVGPVEHNDAPRHDARLHALLRAHPLRRRVHCRVYAQITAEVVARQNASAFCAQQC